MSTVGAGVVVATIATPSERVTKTLPTGSAASSLVSVLPALLGSASAASSSPLPARRGARVRLSSPNVEATTPPSSVKTTAASSWDEISVRSARAAAASTASDLNKLDT